MKNKISFSRLLVAILVFVVSYGFKDTVKVVQVPIAGAWQLDDGNNTNVLIFADGYITHTAFNKNSKTFTESRGGTYSLQNNTITIKWEFDTQEKEKVGESQDFSFTVNGNGLTVVVNGRDIAFERIDAGAGELTGNWKISGRMQDGKRSPVNSDGPRRTLKILSGSRFQWMAINPETKEFFGTGGGSYTFTNGKYTENIEFFSRDSSRVGASLSFDDKIVNGEWHHTGLSSKGEKLYEIWSKAAGSIKEKN